LQEELRSLQTQLSEQQTATTKMGPAYGPWMRFAYPHKQYIRINKYGIFGNSDFLSKKDRATVPF
jgi:hypothetical protein